MHPNRFEMIEAIRDNVDSWSLEELRRFVKDTLLEDFSRAPLAAVVREYQIIRQKENSDAQA